MSRRDEVLERIRSVPEIPTSASRVMQLLGDPEFEMDDLIRVIEMDQAATANLLRLANSAYFGRGASVGTVHEAVVRLGAQRTGQLLMVASVGPIAGRPLQGYDVPSGDLWRHSLGVAVTTELISKELKLRPPGYTFTAGLLHDLGKVVLDAFIQADAERIKGLCLTDNLSFEMAERQILGADHQEVGGELLLAWNLPESLVEAVRWHHSPEGAKENSLATDLVHVANQIVILAGVGVGMDSATYRPSEKCVARLGIDKDTETVVAAKLESELKELEEVFSLVS